MIKEQFDEILKDYYSTIPPPMFKFVLAVDFDLTLAHSNYPDCGKEIGFVCDFVRWVQTTHKDDCITTLWTCRENESLEQAVKWCEAHRLKFDLINDSPKERKDYFGNSRKISYDRLLDDKAYQF
jgi:hypothetical protein